MNGRERKEKRQNSQRRTSGHSIIYFFISVIRQCCFFIMTECHLYKLIQIESKADDDTTNASKKKLKKPQNSKIEILISIQNKRHCLICGKKINLMD